MAALAGEGGCWASSTWVMAETGASSLLWVDNQGPGHLCHQQHGAPAVRAKGGCP